jgi:hypothetical protein
MVIVPIALPARAPSWGLAMQAFEYQKIVMAVTKCPI